MSPARRTGTTGAHPIEASDRAFTREAEPIEGVDEQSEDHPIEASARAFTREAEPIEGVDEQSEDHPIEASARAFTREAEPIEGVGERQRGAHLSIELVEDACTSCMLCTRACPAWCIEITSHPEPDPSLPTGARARTVNVLDEFIIDWSRCMFCGQCIDDCPFDALVWSDRPLAAQESLARLRFGREDLRKGLHT